MTTPYDTLLRLQENKLDELRRQMAAAFAVLAEMQNQQDAIEVALADARGHSPDKLLMAIDPYVAQTRARRMTLLRDQAAIKARLAELQESSTQVFGALAGTRTAVEAYLGECARVMRNAEDMVANDLAATRMTQRGRFSPLREPSRS